MLVTVCEYEQNPSRSVGGVAHTRVWVVSTDGHMKKCKNLNAHTHMERGEGRIYVIDILATLTIKPFLQILILLF